MIESSLHIAFIGGGNMARALIGGLLRQGVAPSHILVVEPFVATAVKLQTDFSVRTMPQAGHELLQSDMVIWAVKPQMFAAAAVSVIPFTQDALHLSVAAGMTTDSISTWIATDRLVRCMPNTPALVGEGITALFSCPSVTAADRLKIEQVISPTGQFLWVQHEAQLDAVTALSGSGPAYVFYFLEAMLQAGTEMGLPADQAYKLAIETFAGAASLARASSDSPEVLRQQVTSQGGTTHAAISSMDASGIQGAFVKAMQAAQARARELGHEYGKPAKP